MEVKMLAQRINYGHRSKNANIYEDTLGHAMWIWEVGNIEKFFSEESQRIIKKMRKNRKRVGQHVRNLYRLVQLLGHSIVNECKVSIEEAKVAKFVLLIEAEQQKAKERERKEQEKVQTQLEKKRLEMERQKAKSAEKAKRALDLEKEKMQSSKRRKSLVSYFRSIDSSGNRCNVDYTASGDCSSNENMLEIEKNSESADIKMARVDAAIGLSTGTDATQVDETSIIYLFKRTTKKSVCSEPVWNGKRTKHSLHGIMKLLQFHENHRPAYYGTFSRKNVALFKRGRRPFAQHPKFDYTVDSDDEWEEDEPGESLSDADSDNEESEGEDNLDYEDRWLAYEDEVDYLDEGNSEGDDDTNADKDARPKQVQLKGKDLKHPKLSKIEMKIIGPHVCPSRNCTEHFDGLYQGQLLQTPSFDSPLILKATTAHETDKAIQNEFSKVDSSIREPLESPEKNLTMEKSSNEMLTTWLHNSEGTSNAIEI
jgi:chromatin assembly factor 1 subunit A